MCAEARQCEDRLRHALAHLAQPHLARAVSVWRDVASVLRARAPPIPEQAEPPRVGAPPVEESIEAVEAFRETLRNAVRIMLHAVSDLSSALTEG